MGILTPQELGTCHVCLCRLIMHIIRVCCWLIFCVHCVLCDSGRLAIMCALLRRVARDFNIIHVARNAQFVQHVCLGALRAVLCARA